MNLGGSRPVKEKEKSSWHGLRHAAGVRFQGGDCAKKSSPQFGLVDREPVSPGKLPGHSCFCVPKHFCFKTLANLTIEIGDVRRRPKPLTRADIGVLIWATVQDCHCVDDHNPSDGTGAHAGVWDFVLLRQVEHLSFIPLTCTWKDLCSFPKC